MGQKTLFEINGITYMSPKAAGDKWGISTQKVTSACKDGRVIGAIKDSENHFIIPIDSPKPLEKETIREALIAILAIKNRPDTRMPNGTEQLLEYLRGIGQIEGKDTLTDKGMKTATTGREEKIDWMNAGLTLLSIVGNLASIWGVISK